MELPEGLTVRYTHIREEDDKGRPLPRGGTTVANLYRGDTRTLFQLVATGHAHCHYRDNYNKRLGREIALGRALKSYRTSRLIPGRI